MVSRVYQEGRDLGLKDAVKKMLERRFGQQLNQATLQRVDAMTTPEIDKIFDRIFTVNSLAELGL